MGSLAPIKPTDAISLPTVALPTGRASNWYLKAMERLLTVVQELSQARDIEAIGHIVREAARSLTGCDGATFVLRDDNQCHYVDEDAIGPLWKGKRFPMEICISGWVMIHAQPVVIEDIYADSRIPVDAYAPTFVKSLVMVPIRTNDPIGAIGNYWASHHTQSAQEISILQALADTTSVAIQNVQLYQQLADRVSELQASNYELSRFAWVASHDLQEPLRTVATQVELLERKYADQLDERAIGYIQTAATGAKRLQNLIESLLVHASAERTTSFRPVLTGQCLRVAMEHLQSGIRESGAQVICGEMPTVSGDAAMLTRVLQNLLSNALKYHKPGVAPRVEISGKRLGRMWQVTVRDDGIGIQPEYHERVFGLFQRLHTQDAFAGSGVGLATCKKIIELHGGTIGLESMPGEGSAFIFTLPAARESGDNALRSNA